MDKFERGLRILMLLSGLDTKDALEILDNVRFSVIQGDGMTDETLARGVSLVENKLDN